MAQPQTTECPAASQLARDGVMHGRFEDDEGLYTGMKDLFGFLVQPA